MSALPDGPLIEYVLVHELAHLGNRSHDRKFWDAVGQWFTDYDRGGAAARAWAELIG